MAGDEVVHPIDGAEAGLPALAKIADKVGITDSGLTKGAWLHFRGLKKGFDFG